MKRLTSILFPLIMALIISNNITIAGVLDSTSNYVYSGKLTQIMEDDESIINEKAQEYLIKRKKQTTADNINKSKVSEVIDKQRNKDVTNIAFFGLDARDIKNPSRSDVIMIVSLDTKCEKVKVTSIMRDMYVEIPGNGDNRINAAYAFGGAELALKTINIDFGLAIKNYVTVDFFGLEKIIDNLGGIEVNVNKDEIPYLNEGIKSVSVILGDNDPPWVTKDGAQMLNGRQIVAYARIRYTGNADFERTERQRRVLNEVLKKIKAKGVLKLPGFVISMLPYVKTNLSTKDTISLGSKIIKFKTENIWQYRLPVDGTYKSAYIRGMSVLVPDLEINKGKLYQFIYSK